MITDRRNPKFRAWLTDKIQAIKSEQQLNVAQDENNFIENYLTNCYPSNSTPKFEEMKNKKTVLGPGYYNVKHSAERNIPSFRFDLEMTSILKEKNLAECVREAK